MKGGDNIKVIYFSSDEELHRLLKEHNLYEDQIILKNSTPQFFEYNLNSNFKPL